MKESTLIDTLWSVAESIWLTKQAQALGTAGLSPRRCLISHRAAWREALLSSLDTRCPNKKKSFSCAGGEGSLGLAQGEPA